MNAHKRIITLPQFYIYISNSTTNNDRRCLFILIHHSIKSSFTFYIETTSIYVSSLLNKQQSKKACVIIIFIIYIHGLIETNTNQLVKFCRYKQNINVLTHPLSVIYVPKTNKQQAACTMAVRMMALLRFVSNSF